MDIERIIDFKFIPEEYTEQIFTLLQSNGKDNWLQIYQLFVGFASKIYQITVIDVAEFYFIKMMRNYQCKCYSFHLMNDIHVFLNEEEWK